MRTPKLLSRPTGATRELRLDPVARTSSVIMASTILTSLLGYVYWIVVVRTAGPQVSGVGAAATSALTAVALMSSVGAAAAMVEWLPRAATEHEWRRRLTVGLVVATGIGLLGGAAAAVVLGWATDTLPALRHPAGVAWFCIGTMTFAIGTVLDYVAVAEQRAGLLLQRNAIFSGLRIAVLFVPLLMWRSRDQVLASWVVATILSLLFVLATFERRVGRRLRLAPGGLRGDLKEMAGSLVGQHFITITAMLAAYLLPILVVARLDAAHASYFYATWMICAVFFMISPAVSTSLFADAVANPKGVASSAVRAGRMILALLVVPMALYLVGGGVLLRLFGPEYASEGRWLMVLLTISALPDAVTNIAVSVLRATRRIAAALWLNASMLLACLAASWLLLPHFGIAAVGIAWLAAQTAGALWVLATWRRIAHPVAETVPA